MFDDSDGSSTDKPTCQDIESVILLLGGPDGIKPGVAREMQSILSEPQHRWESPFALWASGSSTRLRALTVKGLWVQGLGCRFLEQE